MLSEIIERNRSTGPLVHCISNYVTANDCVNLLLASGASGIMADDADEVEEITAMCQALVLNLGTPNPRRLEAMLKAGKAANRLGHPVVFDPVGVGGSTLRREAAARLLKSVRFSVIPLHTLSCHSERQRRICYRSFTPLRSVQDDRC